MIDNNVKQQLGVRAGQTRRTVVQATVASALAAAGLAGTAPSNKARAAADAAKWPKDAFAQKTEADAIKSLYGKTPEASDKVNLDAPEIAENGAVVPISVSTTLPNVTSIAIVVSENPFPLAANYPIPPGTAPMVSNRLKMAKTSKVIALVASGDKVFSASKDVKVTVGGCGG
ncbi:MAG TPA: thiosulfate oxidation carrier protein SoxY [Xanthobacteraceae bacterium]|jgi:sulfur-oxidizing protein SoxY|nr:thiosulfate oxidation carrier protein SoxY [Xanthobacteraceae bacterium]